MWYLYFLAWFGGFVMGGMIIVYTFFKIEEKTLMEEIEEIEKPIEINNSPKYTKDELLKIKEELLYDDDNYIKEFFEEEKGERR